MTPAPHETVVLADGRVGYESHYLKGNSPDGQRAFWVKHTLTRKADGATVLQLWCVRFERGAAPDVWYEERAWPALGDGPRIDDDGLELRPSLAIGPVWDLKIAGGHPLVHLPDLLYARLLPTAKVLTPAAGARFEGVVGDWRVGGWVGCRGHNWGRRHAHRYAWLAVDTPVVIGGFVAQPREGWPTIGLVAPPRRMGLAKLQPGRFEYAGVVATAPPESFVQLDYLGPDGETVPCFCTKFATVTVDGEVVSQAGELEFIGVSVA
ncbi:MAG: hypothetical protein ACOZNI_33135 [Myxococcota bacterium]